MAETFTVVASYVEPPTLYVETVAADSPDEAIDVAWERCRSSNWGDVEVNRTDEWGDVMVIKGTVEVVA
jgi:hypothetical protein